MKDKVFKFILVLATVFSAPMVSCHKTRTSTPDGTINGHEYVDLGLSVMWATCNLGANSPEEYGNYYAWGEIAPKSECTEENSITYGKSMGDIAGDPTYDAAQANCGGTWRLPTKEEIEELKANCTIEWTTYKGVKGMLVTSKKNGKSIFLPATGYRYQKENKYAGVRGYYWSSSPFEDSEKSAYDLYFNSKNLDLGWYFRYLERSVHPVSSNLSSKNTQVCNIPDGTINGHEYVDLGLSVNWATCNMGATTPEEKGCYYAWGETKLKPKPLKYTEENSTTYKKSMDDIASNFNYDVACANWGSTWHLPTKAEIEELIDNCTVKKISFNGVDGMLVTSRINGNSIFLPVAGNRSGMSLNYDSEIGNYWSSSPDETMCNAFYLRFDSVNFYSGWGSRSYGRSVRPVCKKGADDIPKQQAQRGTIKGHEYADLGLSVKWATCNIGANSPTDNGNYYAWGETSPKSTYTKENSITYNKSIGEISGKSNYDVARFNWGGTWRMPTSYEVDELKENCHTRWITFNGVKGMLVTSKINNNSIFFPAAGGCYKSLHEGMEQEFYYWTSTPSEDDDHNEGAAYFLNLNDFSSWAHWSHRYYGFSVRAVSE